MPKKLIAKKAPNSTRRIRPGGTRSKVARPRARRLDPALRRDLILESAAKLVVERGLSGCTLEAVGAAAHISKALVYRYFESREALFGALLQREFDYIRGRKFDLLQDGASLEEALRIHVPRYLEYVAERGALMRALTQDPGVMEQVQTKSRKERGEILDFWAELVVKAFGLPKDLARVGSVMVIAAEEAAEGSIRRGHVTTERVSDFWIQFILGGWAAAAKHYAQ
ncbi:MAG TPA: TetR/AcrR family transcriptional regulator [Steroidobacteraceae bacterium]|nr:TetR/AcrR family transcriptional regulator [Steroidobacteraceae bacterium]